MKRVLATGVLWWMVVAASVEGRALWSPGRQPCSPPLFVFGASYMDVGENGVAMPFRESSELPPYGLDYFDGQPSGRYSNGRLIIDHISQGLGQAFLSPYLQDVGTSFRHGVNFASSGSTACNSSVVGDGSLSSGLFSLSVQVDQFRVFHKRALEMHRLRTGDADRLPSPEDFARGVYIIESGNNDYRFQRDVDEGLYSLVVESIQHAVMTLYSEGARTIVVMDAFPSACYPAQLIHASGPEEISEDGCWIPAMTIHERHNARLRVMVEDLNAHLPDANVIVFSLFDVFMSAIRNPSKFGLKYVHKSCCGYGGGELNFNLEVPCTTAVIVGGQLPKATVCEDRSQYMLWDALHPTDAFTYHVAQAFLNGEHMLPPFHIREMCVAAARHPLTD